MGIERIEYAPWEGERSNRLHRIYVITRKIIHQKLGSKGILAILIIGILIVHAAPTVFNSIAPHERLTAEMMVEEGVEGGYLTNGLFAIFTLLLASIVCSDLISRDLQDNSFILYFSRPLKTVDYLLGKMGGAFGVIGIFCILPPMVFGLVMIGTQTGNNYSGSLEVLGSTGIMGVLTAVIFVSYGILLSSLTEKRSYAGVGTFVSFFVLSITGEIFKNFNPNWKILNPLNILHYSYNLIYGFDLPQDVNPTLFGCALLCILVVPLIIVYYRIHRSSIGK